MNNNFNMCPMCGSKKIECKENRKWFCPDCGFDLYCNVATAVGVIIKDKYNNVLFEIRGKEPRKGFYAVPGGFVDFDETIKMFYMQVIGLPQVLDILLWNDSGLFPTLLQFAEFVECMV